MKTGKELNKTESDVSAAELCRAKDVQCGDKNSAKSFSTFTPFPSPPPPPPAT